VAAISFIVPGTPVPYARTAGGATTARFTPAKQRNAMGVVKLFASRAMNGRAPLEGPIWLSVEAYYQVPKSWSKKQADVARWKTSRPDLDNIVKLIKDSCNQVVWQDDSQVAAMSLSKRYGEREEIRVRIEIAPQ